MYRRVLTLDGLKPFAFYKYFQLAPDRETSEHLAEANFWCRRNVLYDRSPFKSIVPGRAS